DQTYTDKLKRAGMEEALAAALKPWTDLSETVLLSYVRKWRDDRELAVLLDGLDEVPEQDRGQVAQAIRLFQNRCKKCRIIVTSRTAGYIHELGPQFEEYLLKPFDGVKDAVPYVANWLAAMSGWADEKMEEALSLASWLVDEID